MCLFSFETRWRSRAEKAHYRADMVIEREWSIIHNGKRGWNINVTSGKYLIFLSKAYVNKIHSKWG
jgi:hypothetical protein